MKKFFFVTLCYSLISCGHKEDPKPDMSIVMVSTFAGGDEGLVDGRGGEAKFKEPVGIAFAANGDMYVADKGNGAIRKITTDGTVSTVATPILPINCLTVTDLGVIYFATDFKIYRLNADKTITTLASGLDYPQFHDVRGLIMHSDGNLYATQRSNACVMTITPQGKVSRFAGGVFDKDLNRLQGDRDGVLDYALFDRLNTLFLANSGAIYVTDEGTDRICKIFNGQVTTIARSGEKPAAHFADGTTTNALFWAPKGIVAASDDILYFVDSNNGRVRKITLSANSITTIAGGDHGTFKDGEGSSARFNNPTDIIMDKEGNLFVADPNNNRIRKITFQK